MTATVARTLSAVQLLEQLRPYHPTVEGDALVFAFDPPEDLWQMAMILQTGLRAILINRRWFGIDTDGHSCGPHPVRAVPVQAVTSVAPLGPPAAAHR